MRAHNIISPGLHLPSCSGRRSITHNNIAFADDTDNHASADYDSPNPVEEVLVKANKSAQAMSELIDICGGSLALQKTQYRVMAWDDSKGVNSMKTEIDGKVIMGDGKGVQEEIKFSRADEPNVGLGFEMRMDGKMDHQFKATKSAFGQKCGRIASSQLTEREAFTALQSRLTPALSYVMHHTNFDETQCGTLNTLMRRAILPQLRLNRNFPHALTFGPKCYGGLEFPETYTLQNQLQISYMISRLRHDKTVANSILTALETAQI